MRHQKTRHKLSRDAAHRKALLANLCIEVIDHERIKTTEAKAKAVKPEIEKLITLAKQGRPARAPPGDLDPAAPRQGRHLQAVRGDRPALHRASGRLHPDPQARPASSRRDRDGLPRARVIKALARACEVSKPHSWSPSSTTARPFAGWAVQPGQRTVAGELEAALATVLRAPVDADRRRPHRPRRARARAGRLLRGRAAAAALASTRCCRDEIAVLRRRGGARRLLRPPRRAAAARYVYRVLARARAVAVRARPRAVVAAPRRRGGAARLRARCCPARTTSPPSRPTDDLPPALRARRARARGWERARRRARVPRSRPTRSCAT